MFARKKAKKAKKVDLEGFPEALSTRSRLFIGPTNSAGQGFRWANAVTAHVRHAAGHSFRLAVDERPFPNHYCVEAVTFRHDMSWREEFASAIESRYTHVIFESYQPLFGAQKARARDDVLRLREAGVRVAMLAHGSDVRIPSRHNELEPWSQFPHMDADFVAKLEELAIHAGAVLREFDGPVFVSTPGLLDFLPAATWCPVVVDIEEWDQGRPLFESSPPVVAHIPSSGQKGSILLDPILRELESGGLIRYLRVSGVAPDEMPGLIAGADIVVDLLGSANYGVAACEAMAAGRVVVSHVSDRVRDRVVQHTGFELPIVEATPPTLAATIRELIDDPTASRLIAEQGRDFVRAVHDGRHSAGVLAPFLSKR